VWLFPGDLPGQPITRDAVGQACQKAHRASRYYQTNHSALAEALFRAPDYSEFRQQRRRRGERFASECPA
jgi:hypothetical protein